MHGGTKGETPWFELMCFLFEPGVYKRTIRNAIKISNKRGVPIEAGQADCKRLQLDVTRSWLSSGIVKRILLNLDKCGVLKGRTITELSILHSLPGCLEQDEHTDWSDSEIKRSLRHDGIKPMVCIAALKGTSWLLISDGDRVRRRLSLEPGNALVFEGDLIHAGGSQGATSSTRLYIRFGRRGNNIYLVVDH